MERRYSTSLLGGLALASFAAFVIAACHFNNESLNRLMMDLEVIVLLIGVPYISVASIFVGSMRLHTRTEIEKKGISPSSKILCISILTSPIMIVFLFCPGLTVIVVPLIVLCAQLFAGTALFRSGISRDCKLLLIAAVLLSIAAGIVANSVGTKKDPDVEQMLLSPQVLCWLACATAATFRTASRAKTVVADPATAAESAETERNLATLLWTTAAMVWMVTLLWIEGISEKGSL